MLLFLAGVFCGTLLGVFLLALVSAGRIRNEKKEEDHSSSSGTQEIKSPG